MEEIKISVGLERTKRIETVLTDIKDSYKGEIIIQSNVSVL